MADDTGLTITIAGDASSLKDALSDTATAVQGLSQGLEASAQGVGSAWDVAFGVGAAELFQQALEKLWEGAKEIFTEVVTESIAAASANEDAVNKMNIALADSGNYSAAASADFQAFAESIQKTTTYSENQVLTAGALIEQLTHLDEDGLKQATHGSIELASALGIDLNTAALMVAKGINGNVTAFQRYGITVEAGSDQAENFTNIMKALAQFTGVAEQQAQSYSGSVEQLTHAHEEGQKVLGQVWTQNVAVIDVMHAVTDLFYENAEATKANQQAYRVWIAEGIVVAIKSLGLMVGALDEFAKASTATFEAAILPLKVFIAGLVAAQQAIHGNFAEAWTSFKTNGVDAFNDIKKAFGDSKLTELGTDLAKIQQAAETGLGAVEKGAIAAVNPINQSTVAVKELTAAQQALIDQGLKIIAEDEKRDPKKKYDADIAALRAANDAKKISDQQYQDAAFKAGEEEDKAIDKIQEESYNKLVERNKLLVAADAKGNAAEIASNQAKEKAILDNQSASSTLSLQAAAVESQKKQQIQEAEAQAIETTLTNFATFQNAQNTTMAKIGQTAAVASTLIATYEGATKAASAVANVPIIGPGLAVAVAASFVAAGLENVAKIEGVSFAQGGLVTGGTPGLDSVPAMLTPGELVVPNENFQDVVNSYASSQGGSNGQQNLTTVQLQFNGDFGKVVEASIAQRQRNGTSILKKVT